MKGEVTKSVSEYLPSASYLSLPKVEIGEIPNFIQVLLSVFCLLANKCCLVNVCVCVCVCVYLI